MSAYANLQKQLQYLTRKLDLFRTVIDSKPQNGKAQIQSTCYLISNLNACGDSYHVENILKRHTQLKTQVENFQELLELANKDPGTFTNSELQQEIGFISSSFDEHFTSLLSNFPNASSPCFIAFTAGAGGVDSDDWVKMLKKMYSRHALRHERQVQCLEETSRSAVLEIQGHMAFAWYQYETGVHRLIRLNPANVHHTAFASISVTPTLPDEPLQIDPHDLVYQTFKSGGKGGQSVNKTESAVRIIHTPTGIAIKCQQERSQHHNEATALKLLHHRLLKLKIEAEQAASAAHRQSLLPNTFGSQIRSYILHPHTLVKDHITGYSTNQLEGVLEGEGEMDNLLESSILFRLKNISNP